MKKNLSIKEKAKEIIELCKPISLFNNNSAAKVYCNYVLAFDNPTLDDKKKSYWENVLKEIIKISQDVETQS